MKKVSVFIVLALMFFTCCGVVVTAIKQATSGSNVSNIDAKVYRQTVLGNAKRVPTEDIKWVGGCMVVDKCLNRTFISEDKDRLSMLIVETPSSKYWLHIYPDGKIAAEIHLDGVRTVIEDIEGLGFASFVTVTRGDSAEKVALYPGNKIYESAQNMYSNVFALAAQLSRHYRDEVLASRSMI